MRVDNGNIYMNGQCIAFHRHNSSDLEPSPALSLQKGHKHKATLLFPIPVCVCVCILARFNNVYDPYFMSYYTRQTALMDTLD